MFKIIDTIYLDIAKFVLIYNKVNKLQARGATWGMMTHHADLLMSYVLKLHRPEWVNLDDL